MKTTKIRVEICDNRFTEEKREEMWRVYEPHYRYSKASFLQRIANHNYYAMYYRANVLVGFTGLRIENRLIAGERRFMIYFGQTIIDPAVRSKALLPRTGMQLCKMFWRELLVSKAYFWADALTYKAYLVFAKTLKEYYPSRRRELPQEVQTVRDYLGAKYYAKRYCSQRGTVCKDEYVVSDPQIRTAPRRSLDPDVRYFLQANSLHESGSGLLTIAPIHLANVWMILRKIVQKTSLYVRFRRKSRKLRVRSRRWAYRFSTVTKYAA